MTALDRRTAVLVVDVQNDFADPAGSLSVAGGDAIIPRINDELERAAGSGALVIFSQDWHPTTTPHFAKDGGIWPVHCVAGSWGAELHPALHAVGERIRKGIGGEDGYSAFTVRDPLSGAESGTGLQELLEQRGVRRAVLCGLATDYCVRATALDARRLGLATVLLMDAIAAVDLQPGDGERAIAEMAAAGVELG